MNSKLQSIGELLRAGTAGSACKGGKTRHGSSGNFPRMEPGKVVSGVISGASEFYCGTEEDRAGGTARAGKELCLPAGIRSSHLSRGCLWTMHREVEADGQCEDACYHRPQRYTVQH